MLDLLTHADSQSFQSRSKFEEKRFEMFDPFVAMANRVRFILLGERFFHNFQSLEIIYGGVLSLFVQFSRTKNIMFVNIPIFGGKKQENREDCIIARNKCRKYGEKSSPIRITLTRSTTCNYFYSGSAMAAATSAKYVA